MNIHFNIPKNPGFGEDAPPIHLISANSKRYLVGVFDGLGGAGSTLYKENENSYTGAYIASRLVKEITESFFVKRMDEEDFIINEDTVEQLKEEIIEGLREKLNTLKYEQTKIISNLIKTFPTTLAIGLLDKRPDTNRIYVIWAGDSRIYSLNKQGGLIQLSKDDLKEENDPYQNLQNDSPLGNMVSMDKDFQLNFTVLDFPDVSAILAVTDGCFGYYPTPIHFEDFLLRTMAVSNSLPEWEEKLIWELRNVSGDDFSFSLLFVDGNDEDFNVIKGSFNSRWKELKELYMNDIREVETNINKLKEEEKRLRERISVKLGEQNDLYRLSWEKYKKSNYYREE